MLKALEISGFKSFAKKTSLEFKSQITSIVGPNGSGKSNVAESFRFVLGEQSMRSMRGKRGEDLIWNGSEESLRSNRAAVKVIFDNNKKVFNLDFDEISIERIVHRDGGNQYLINGSEVRLKDVVELLSQAHIGASGHHIISQGEADRILSANIKERREMVEDALGLKIYQYKKEESERKLSKTRDNIREVELLRKEVAPHLKFLKKQVEKAEKAEEVRNRLTEFYREYLKREEIYLRHSKEQIKMEEKPLLEKLKELDGLMEDAKALLEGSLNKDRKSQNLIEVEDKIKKHRDERDELWREAGKIEGEISAAKRSLGKMEVEYKSAESKTVLLKEVEDLEKEVLLFSEVNKILETIRWFITKHKDKVDSKSLEELRELVIDLENKKKEFEEKIKSIDVSVREAEEEYTIVRESIEKEKNSEREAEKTIFKISAEQSELRSKLNILDSDKKRLQMAEENWKREVEEGGVLLGSAVTGFNILKIVDHSGSELSEQEILVEDRARQEERRHELEKMKIRLEELGGVGGAEVLKEYKETEERDAFLTRELGDLAKSAESLTTMIADLEQRLDTEFREGIVKINKAFQNFFEIMFGGGSAELSVIQEKPRIRRIKDELSEIMDYKNEDNLDEDNEVKLETGVDINVSLPKKRIKSLEMLSGGERALTSIALLFAVSQVNPPPFIILDETDAALDEANSKRYGDMIESLSKYSQLILITHNRETMSRAGIIYGVTMGSGGVSRLLSIAFDEALSVAK